MALEPRDQLFRTMLALSVGFHAALFVGLVLWSGLSKSSPRYIPVAVVDLVGGLEPEPRPAEPGARPAAPARGASRGKAPAVPRGKAARERPAKPARLAKRASVPPARMPPPETRELSEKIRKLRESRASQDRVQEALGALRREKEARAAVGRVRERVAHRVDLSGLRTPPDRAPQPAGAGIPGASGSTRVPPEQLEYFRALYEKVYESWVLIVPGEARAGSESLIAQIRIRIEKDGRVAKENIEIEKSSGNRFFDESVLRAIGKASPLPVPPEKLRGTEDHYEVGFRFRPPPKGEW